MSPFKDACSARGLMTRPWRFSDSFQTCVLSRVFDSFYSRTTGETDDFLFSSRCFQSGDVVSTCVSTTR